MLYSNDLYNFLGINESFQLPNKLKETLLVSEDSKNQLCDFLLSKTEIKDEDIFLDYYQRNLANRSELKQDYTPISISRLLNKIVEPSGTVIDMCCGTGGLTIPQFGKHQLMIFQELSESSIPFILCNLIIRNIPSIVFHGDVLKREFKSIYKISKGNKYGVIKMINEYEIPKVDLVISNPPYSLPFEFSNEDDRFIGYSIPPKSKADYGFVLTALVHLNEGGQAYFILPHGILFRGGKEEEIRTQLIKNNLVESIVGLPSNMFFNTQIPTCLLVLNKSKNDNKILFVDASQKFEKDGKINKFLPEHIELIATALKQRLEINKFSSLVDLKKIEDNDYNLNIPRYVDITEKVELPPIDKTYKELLEINKEIEQAEWDLNKQLKELETTSNCPSEVDKAFEEYKKLFNDQCSKDTVPSFEEFISGVFDEVDKISKAPYTNYLLQDIATIQRSIKGCIYPKGSILIQLSASKGQTLYLDKASEVYTKYAVIICNPNILSYGIYWLLKRVVEINLSKIIENINIPLENLFKLEIPVLDDPVDRLKQDIIFREIDIITKAEEETIDNFKSQKSFLLKNMFI